MERERECVCVCVMYMYFTWREHLWRAMSIEAYASSKLAQVAISGM